MKRLVLAALIIVVASYSAPAIAQDPAKVGPNIYKCILENERVRLCEIRFKPGDSIAVHSHPDHMVYVIAPGKLRITAVGGQPAELDFKAGQSVWIPAEAHSAVNVGNSELRGLVIELKDIGAEEAALMKMERDWSNAMVKGDFAPLESFIAPEWTMTTPTGQTQTRAEAMRDLRSGDLKFESTSPSDMQARIYGDTAIVTGRSIDKVKYKGMDMSGEIRFTDVFVKRNGKWQAVSTTVTRVVPPQ